MLRTMTFFVFLALQGTSLFGNDSPFALRNPRYRLQPTDQLTITFRYTPEYDGGFSIQPDGFAAVPLAGELRLSDLTMEQAEAAILEKLKIELRDPQITLNLTQFVLPTFVVAGQVANPGRFPIHGDVTAVEGIAEAGGFKDSAKHSQVILFRRTGPDTASTHIYNLKKLMDPANPSPELSERLMPGDVLVVPQNRVSKIDRYIHWANVGMFVNPIK